MLIAHVCSMHGYRARGHYMRVLHVAIPCVTISHVEHDKLHETCMFHATRKRGPHKHVTGLFKVFIMLPRMYMRVKMKSQH